MTVQREPTDGSSGETIGERFERAFVQRMRLAREHQKLSQPALAKQLLEEYGIKIDPSSIARMEKGSRMVRFGEAVAIARILGQDLERMARSDTPLEEQAAHTRAQLHEVEARLMNIQTERAELMEMLAKLESELRSREMRRHEAEKARQALESAEMQWQVAQKRLQEIRETEDDATSIEEQRERVLEMQRELDMRFAAYQAEHAHLGAILAAPPTSREPSPGETANPLAAIRALLPGLARAEQRVANVVLDDPFAVSGWSITQVAFAANTSETTVTRFCKAVGLDSYPQLRERLARFAELGRMFSEDQVQASREDR